MFSFGHCPKEGGREEAPAQIFCIWGAIQKSIFKFSPKRGVSPNHPKGGFLPNPNNLWPKGGIGSPTFGKYKKIILDGFRNNKKIMGEFSCRVGNVYRGSDLWSTLGLVDPCTLSIGLQT